MKLWWAALLANIISLTFNGWIFLDGTSEIAAGIAGISLACILMLLATRS